MALTHRLIRKYIRSGGTACPYCGFEQLEGASVDIEGGGAHQEISCLRCKRRWVDSYLLVNIIEIEEEL